MQRYSAYLCRYLLQVKFSARFELTASFFCDLNQFALKELTPNEQTTYAHLCHSTDCISKKRPVRVFIGKHLSLRGREVKVTNCLEFDFG